MHLYRRFSQFIKHNSERPGAFIVLKQLLNDLTMLLLAILALFNKCFRAFEVHGPAGKGIGKCERPGHKLKWKQEVILGGRQRNRIDPVVYYGDPEGRHMQTQLVLSSR